MSLYNDCQIPYNAPVPYNGIVTPDCGYNQCISYNTPMLYNTCAVPPIPPTPIAHGGGGIYQFKPSPWQRKLEKIEEDEALVAMLAILLDDE